MKLAAHSSDFFSAALRRLLCRLLACCLLLSPVTPAAYAQGTDQLNLPELGDSSSSLISLNQEYQLGRAWLKAFRSQAPTINDPLLQDYLEDLIFKLANYSELKDRRLEVVVVDNRSINAFAVPGGVIGVHNGLLLYADNEAQLSSVLAHELAHLSQRHFARRLEQQQNSQLPTMAGLLASLVLAATIGADAGLAGMTATQAASLQNQLRYSRQNEQEADRAGMQTMIRADIDIAATAGMFEKMLQASRYAGSRPPEFLLTHPITESRITDARNRARQQPRKMYTDSLEFQLMRARVELHFQPSSQQAIRTFKARMNGNSKNPEADQYGLVLAYLQINQADAAREALAPLLAKRPRLTAYRVADARIDLSQGQYRQAIDKLEQELAVTPGNHPLVMQLAEAYLLANQPSQASELLQQHSQRHPQNPNIWYLLAEAYGLAGDIVGVHQARAEYFLLNGALGKARQQLSYALPLVSGDNIRTVRIQEKMRQIAALQQAAQNL